MRSVSIVALLVGLCGNGQAAVIFTATESGGNVVISGGGTINLFGLEDGSVLEAGAAVNPTTGYLGVGTGSDVDSQTYFPVSGPTDFGPGFASPGPDFSDGDLFGRFSPGNLFVPLDYNSGAPFTSSSTWVGQSIASLGMTPGTYVWTWGEGATADSMTLTVVPEPTTIGMLGMGIVAVVWLSRRRRRA